MCSNRSAWTFKSYRLADGTQAIVFHTGTHKQIVLATFCNGPTIPIVTQYVVTIDGATPDPDPQPDPEAKPDGLAGDVYERAKSVAMSREIAQQAADNFEAVSSAIAAGGIKTIRDAMSKIAELNNRFWPRSTEAFVHWVEAYLEQHASTLEKLKEIFDAIVEGLRAI